MMKESVAYTSQVLSALQLLLVYTQLLLAQQFMPALLIANTRCKYNVIATNYYELTSSSLRVSSSSQCLSSCAQW
jgi:hypothetical protein